MGAGTKGEYKPPPLAFREPYASGLRLAVRRTCLPRGSSWAGAALICGVPFLAEAEALCKFVDLSLQSFDRFASYQDGSQRDNRQVAEGTHLLERSDYGQRYLIWS